MPYNKCAAISTGEYCMKTQIVSRLLALSLCATGVVTLMSQSPVSATEYSWCWRGADWSDSWRVYNDPCELQTNPNNGFECVGSCYQAQTVVKSPDRCYKTSARENKCKECQWDNPATVTFYDQERIGTCLTNGAGLGTCSCTYDNSTWQDFPHNLNITSAPIQRCYTVNPCL